MSRLQARIEGLRLGGEAPSGSRRVEAVRTEPTGYYIVDPDDLETYGSREPLDRQDLADHLMNDEEITNGILEGSILLLFGKAVDPLEHSDHEAKVKAVLESLPE